MHMRVTLSGNLLKILTIGISVIVISAAGVLIYELLQPKNPVPTKIKKQISYKVIYPPSSTIVNPNSGYEYKTEDKTLTFSSKSSGATIVLVQQPAPDTLSANGQVYYPALGIHPYAQFQSKLGPVALTKFWKSSSLEPAGQSGVLATNGTLLIARSDKDLTNAQWKDFFDTLKITR